LGEACRPRSTRPFKGPFAIDRAAPDDQDLGPGPIAAVASLLISPLMRPCGVGGLSFRWIDKGVGPYYLSRLFDEAAACRALKWPQLDRNSTGI
jgi:hypothetical protein